MRVQLQLLCSCLLCFGSVACGSRQIREDAEPSDGVSHIIQRWESGADIGDFVDPRRGLLVLRYCAPAAENTSGCQPSSYLHCGESLRRATTVLGEDLEMRQNYTHGAHIYECNAEECHHPPMMEYDYEGTLRFDTSVEPPVLIEVLHVEGGNALGSSIPWADEQRASHQTRRCALGSG